MNNVLKRPDTKVKWIMWSVVSLALIHILWGAVVRATGSGLGCPDWPLCSGQVIPPFETAAVIEFVHRFLALFLTVGVIWVLVKAWFGQGRLSQIRPIVLAFASLLVVQIVLGAVTVLTELPALLVGSHLTISMLFIALMVMGAVQVQTGSLSVHAFPKWRGIAALLAGLLVVVSGAFVVGMSAGIACHGIFSCDSGGGSPRLLQEVHMGHRYAAYVFTIALTLLAGWRLRVDKSNAKFLGILVIALLALQITLGFTQVLLGLPEALRVGHVFTAALIMAAATALFFWPLARGAEQPIAAVATEASPTQSPAPDPA
ncbi:MAG: heme A synthase [Chloroflexi bacterium]|nr:heme A synthase [Chloroflexota bacterium]